MKKLFLTLGIALASVTISLAQYENKLSDYNTGIFTDGVNGNMTVSAYNGGTGNAFRFVVNSSNTNPHPSGGISLLNITKTGNVGIGTTSPLYKLHTVTTGNTNYVSSFLYGDYYGTMVGVNTTSPSYYAFNVASGIAANSSGGNSIFTVRADGNVGIGTTSPGYKLDVNGSMNIGNISSGSNAILNFSTNASGGPRSITYRAADASMSIDNTGGNALMTIQNGGNVGIGTTTPLAKLSVIGSSTAADGTDQTGIFQVTSGTGANTDNKLIIGVHNDDYSWIQGIKPGTDVTTLVLNGLGGNVLIGKTTQLNATYKLDINGSARANEIVVNTTGADFVFEPKYNLPKLTKVKAFIDKNHHLPEIPPAVEMQKNGMSVGELNTKLLQKIEELTLYLIEQSKQIIEQQAINQSLQNQINRLKKN